MIALIQDLESRIPTAEESNKDAFLHAKSNIERSLELHNARPEANMRDLQHRLIDNRARADALKIEKRVVETQQMLQELEQADDDYSKEQKERLASIREAIALAFEALEELRSSLM